MAPRGVHLHPREVVGGESGRVRELDGLRGVAILLVVVAHATTGVWPAGRGLGGGRFAPVGGGFVGVQLFFVLSGFLITTILVRERDHTHHVELARFYLRRLRRLLPALLVLLATFLVIVSIRYPHQREAAWQSAFRVITYTKNFGGVGGLPNNKWLLHTWSLAVEEQFYLAWGACVAFLPHRWIMRAALLGIAVTYAVRFAVPMAGTTMYLLAQWDGLLIGCVLALRPVRVSRAVGLIATTVLAVYTCSSLGALPIRAADFTIVALSCGVVLMYATSVRWLRNGVLVWFGTISYGLYLWHYFILQLGPPPLVGGGVSIAIAAASWYGIERRFLTPRRAR